MGEINPANSAATSGVPAVGAGGGFWQAKTIDELAAEQGVSVPQDLDALLGAGKDLWADDAEFDAFLADLSECRRQGA